MSEPMTPAEEAALRAALREALDIIESINGCHGCLDNGSEDQQGRVAFLERLAAASEPVR